MSGKNFLGFNRKPSDTKVVVAMSGGVDSSTVAGIMKKEGYNVIGITLKLYDDGKEVAASKQCCSGQDIMDAKRVAHKLGIEHKILYYQDKFKQGVIDNFVESYLKGETPIPCVQCNQTVKFKDLFDVAKDLKAENAMAILLKDAIKPNLVQTLEGNPAIIHGGPFANIAQGTNTVIATKIGGNIELFNNDTGILIEPENPEELLYEIISTIDNNIEVYLQKLNRDTQIGVKENNKNEIPNRPLIDSALTENTIQSELVGTVIDIKVLPNKKIKQGDTVLVQESMKMHHPIKANANGFVSNFFVDIGDTVSTGSPLFEFIPEKESSQKKLKKGKSKKSKKHKDNQK